MPLHLAIAALQGSAPLQRQAQARIDAALARWRADCGLVALEGELARYGQGAVLDDVPTVAALFGPDAAGADVLVGGLIGAVAAALTDQPLSPLALRHALDDQAATLVLARAGAAALSLQALDGAALAQRAPATTAVFQPGQAVARVLRGAGQARVAKIGATGAIVTERLALRPGQILKLDGARETLLLDSIAGHLLLLKLQRRCGEGPAREIDMASGALLRQAAGSSRDSRLELATALLGRMGRADSAPLLADMAREPGSPPLRWHVLRECLALDSAAGFAALSRIAADPDDPLASPAAALQAQLLTAHPQLQALDPCPA